MIQGEVKIYVMQSEQKYWINSIYMMNLALHIRYSSNLRVKIDDQESQPAADYTDRWVRTDEHQRKELIAGTKDEGVKQRAVSYQRNW
jgi:hypothetical protein